MRWRPVNCGGTLEVPRQQWRGPRRVSEEMKNAPQNQESPTVICVLPGMSGYWPGRSGKDRCREEKGVVSGTVGQAS